MTAILELEDQSTGFATGWNRVCAVEELELAWGEAALIAGRQVALFRTAAAEVFAVAQEDPATGAHVMARGIVGSRGTRQTIASPCTKRSTTSKQASASAPPGSASPRSAPVWWMASSRLSSS